MVKVAENTYRLANERGALKIYLTWCMLKEYNSHGCIKRDKVSVSKAAKFLSKSTSTLRLHLNKLVKLGLVRRHKYSYSLVSYDKGWELLGLDTSQNPKKDRLGNFIIFKHNIIDLKEKVELDEIVVKQQRQAFQARKSILRNDTFTDAEKNALKAVRFMDLPGYLDDIYLKRSHVLKEVEGLIDNTNMVRFCEMTGRKFKYLKITPYLTCENTSVILGYEKNPAMGQNIRKGIQKKGLAVWGTRSAEFLNIIPWDNAVIGERLCRKSERVKDNGLALSHRLISSFTVL